MLPAISPRETQPTRPPMVARHDSILALGFNREQQPQPPEPRKDKKANVVVGAVGDAAAAALNAAALQTLSLKQSDIGQYKLLPGGRVSLAHQAHALLDGVNSHDISFIAEQRAGQARLAGLSVTAENGGASHRGDGGARSRTRAHKEAPSHKTQAAPTGRADAVATADQLRRSLLDLASDAESEQEMNLWHSAFAEIIKQVHVQCNERGDLLEAIRARYVEALAHPRGEFAPAEPTAMELAQHRTEQAEKLARQRRSQNVIRFNRAVRGIQREHLTHELEFEQQLRKESEFRLRLENEQLQTQLSLVTEQLAETKRKISELQAAFNRPDTVDEVYRRAVGLSGEDQVELLWRLLMRPIDSNAPGLLSQLPDQRRYDLLVHLLSSLPEAAVVTLLQRLLPVLLPSSLHLVAQTALLAHMQPLSDGGYVRDINLSGQAIAHVFRVHSPEQASASELAEESKHRKQLAESVLASLGMVSSTAPEFYEVMIRLVPRYFPVPQPDEKAIAWWEKQVALRNATIADLERQLKASQSDVAQANHVAASANAEIARLRKQLQSALDATSEAIITAADHGVEGARTEVDLPQDSYPSSPEVALSSPEVALSDVSSPRFSPDADDAKLLQRASSVGLKLTTTLMRTYREELKRSHRSLLELEDRLRQQEERFRTQLAEMQEALDAKTSDIAKAMADLHSLSQELDEARRAYDEALQLRRQAESGRDAALRSMQERADNGQIVPQPASPPAARGGAQSPRRSSRRPVGDSFESDQADQRKELGARDRRKARRAISLEAVILDSKGAKPMSFTFLFRLLSNIVASKLVADEKALLAGLVPHSLDEFLSYQMVSFYGVVNLAIRYLQEMYVGLKKMRKKHPRLGLFASALGVFPDAVIMPEAYLLVLHFMRAMLELLEAEKLITRTSSSSFFAFYSRACTVFLPCDYLQRAASDAHVDHPTLCDEVVAFVATATSGPHALRNKAACMARAAKGTITKRAAVIGEGIEGAVFVDLDHFLLSLAKFYHTMIERRQERVSHCLDESTKQNHVMSKDEFCEMLEKVRDMNAYPISATQQQELYDQLVTMGGGVIQHDQLFEMLHILDQRAKAETMTPCHLELVEAGERERNKAQLLDMTRGWELLRKSMSDTPPSESRLQFFLSNEKDILLIQRIWRGCLIRRRLLQIVVSLKDAAPTAAAAAAAAAPAKQPAATAPPAGAMKVGSLFGMSA